MLAAFLIPVSAVLFAQPPLAFPLDLAAANPISQLAGAAQPRFTSPGEEEILRLEEIQAALAEQPGQEALLAERSRLLQGWLEHALAMGKTGRLGEMAALLDLVEQADPEQPGLEEARTQLQEFQQFEGWFEQAEAAMSAGRLVEPPGRNAAFYLDKVLQAQPGNGRALLALSSVQSRLLQRARQAAAELDFELAESWLEAAADIPVNQAPVEQARIDLTSRKWRQADHIEQEVRRLIQEGEFNRAEIQLIDLVALGVDQDQVAALRGEIEQARTYGTFDPNEVFRDRILGTDALAPAMIVVPAGSFLMGASDRETEAPEDQRPQHRVTIARGFALGKNEISVAEFGEFVRVTRYRTEAEREGHSKVYNERIGRLTKTEGINWRHDYAGQNAAKVLPVLHISWNDAQAYVSWLANATGKPYRLPTEAEFEYALRAGTMSAYWWGSDTPAEVLENLTGDGDSSPGGRNWSVAFRNYADGFWGPAPVASFVPNGFGLYDMGGNVSEWVQDCWHAGYLRAPVNGMAWVNPGCQKRVIRGGYWASSPAQARSAARLFAESSLRGPRVGLRIARDL